jgi:hypothetical protein
MREMECEARYYFPDDGAAACQLPDGHPGQHVCELTLRWDRWNGGETELQAERQWVPYTGTPQKRQEER